MNRGLGCAAIAVLCAWAVLPTAGRAAGGAADVGQIVAQAAGPLMARYGVPGLAVGVVTKDRAGVFDFGVASKATGMPVTGRTLFEIGSVSKTFTATLAAYAAVMNALSLSDPASKSMPSLRGSRLDGVSLLELGTHTAGGFAQQLPDSVTNEAQLIAYFRNWIPTDAPGTRRTYANPNIGLLGLAAAASLDEDFAVAMDRRLLPGLGLHDTFLEVPGAATGDYAQGYTKADAPIRMAPQVLAAETYGIRASAGDLLRFVEANIGQIDLAPAWRRAIMQTHTGYFRIGAMTQDLAWEQYRYPVALKDLQAGNSSRMSDHSNPVIRLDPPLAPSDDVLIDKTGSTNGFAAYVAFVPGRRLGLVLLANKNIPIAARVTAGYEILTRLDRLPARN